MSKQLFLRFSGSYPVAQELSVLLACGETLRVGRSESNHVVIANPYVSREHLQFFWREEECFVRDCGSSNGTTVNGSLLDGEQHIDEGDKIEFHGVSLVVLPDVAACGITCHRIHEIEAPCPLRGPSLQPTGLSFHHGTPHEGHASVRDRRNRVTLADVSRELDILHRPIPWRVGRYVAYTAAVVLAVLLF